MHAAAHHESAGGSEVEFCRLRLAVAYGVAELRHADPSAAQALFLSVQLWDSASAATSVHRSATVFCPVLRE